MTLKKTPIYAALLLITMLVLSSCSPAASTAIATEPPQMFRPRNGSTNTQRTLGDLVASEGLDDNGCATNPVSQFEENDSVYTVLQDSTFPAGTRLFARLYRDNQAVEDSEELVADQAYTNVCVNFEFAPSARAEVWETGDYEIEFYVNGNAHDSVEFEIR